MRNSHQQTQTPLQCIDSLLNHGLYQIKPINQSLDKRTLSMAYSPGVGAVCMAIKNKQSLVNELTLRGRSIAIVTQGRYSQNHHFPLGNMPPILDWCIAQAKFYGNVDCYPFIIRHSSKIPQLLKDLSNSYSAVVWLDHTRINAEDVPKDIAFVHIEDLMQYTKDPKTNWQSISLILAYILKEKMTGLVKQDVILKGIQFKPDYFKKQSQFLQIFNDGRSLNEHAIDMHKKFEGKILIEPNFINISTIKGYFTEENLLEYVQKYSNRGYTKLSAIITDGTAILGYGNIGPRAGLPVMEGKSLLFKSLGGVGVVPICINKRETIQEQVQAILDIASYFKAINLQDIKAPECFKIESQLAQKKILPIFHDDQHGTAIITLAALINAVKVADKDLQKCKIVINGAGAAGMNIAKLLLKKGATNIIVSDTKCSIYEGRPVNMNDQKTKIAQLTNPDQIQGCLDTLLKDADIFIGVSVAGAFKKQWVKIMAEKQIIFAMANPDPEIDLQDALDENVFIYASGRSDYKNQINNSLVFPGVFRSFHTYDFDAITEEMKIQIAELIAESIQGKLSRTKLIPDSLDRDVPAKICAGLQKFKKKQ